MAITESNNPNHLRKSAARKIEQAKGLQSMLEEGTQIGSAAETEDRIDTLLTEAQAEKDAAAAIEQREDEATRRGGGRQITAPGTRRRGAFNADRPQTLSQWLAADASDLDDGDFESMGDYLAAVRDQRSGKRPDDRLQALEYQAVGQFGSGGPDGGFTMPSYFQREIVETIVEDEPWLRMLNVFVLPNGQGREVVTPILSDRDRSGEDVGGVELQRVGETGQIGLSSMLFESRIAQLTKAATRVRVSNELLSDNAVGLSSLINTTFSKAVSLRQALDVMGGTGVGSPTGLIDAAATYSQAKEGSQTADTITGNNLVAMRSRAALYNRMIWLAHPSTYVQLASAHTTLTNDDRPLFAPGNGVDVPDTILGRPIYFSEGAKLLGDKGDIVLFNPAMYTYVMKPLRVDLSSHYRFDTDETEFRVVLRDDGGPIHSSTRTDARGYVTSEYVTLAERA